jgi:hypothetical protein
MSEDFSKGKRGPVVKSGPNKVRITIRLDADIIDHFKQLVHEAGGGNFQTLINDALRDYCKAHDKPNAWARKACPPYAPVKSDASAAAVDCW